MNIKEFLTEFESCSCPCGKEHKASLKHVLIEEGALKKLPEIVRDLKGSRVFIVADANTWAAAGSTVSDILKEAGFPVASYCFGAEKVEPDEHAVGSVIMHYDSHSDIIIGVGSGVINDISKIVSNIAKVPYIIVGTAPSMDGYASATSSMSRAGLKVSLNSRMPSAIVADPVILASAPMKSIQSGMGDMLAKYVSICEWRIAHEVVGEYYCERVASLVRLALKKCVDQVEGMKNRDPQAMAAVMEGLVIGGLAMNYAGLSRPASGLEHYFSHIWDMRGLEFGLPFETHGNMCAIGTLLALRFYEKVRTITPDRDKAMAAAAAFCREDWNKVLRTFIGTGAEAMIQNEDKEQKYSASYHERRLNAILAKWDTLKTIMDEELPSYEHVLSIMKTLDAPLSASDFGYTPQEVCLTFAATKDIRDKYIGSMLAWDLGLLEEAKTWLL